MDVGPVRKVISRYSNMGGARNERLRSVVVLGDMSLCWWEIYIRIGARRRSTGRVHRATEHMTAVYARRYATCLKRKQRLSRESYESVVKSSQMLK